MPLLKDETIVADTWTYVGDDEDVPDAESLIGGVIVSAARWFIEKDALRRRNAPVGVQLRNDQPIADIADYLDGLDLVVLVFPAFTDGRAYSAARMLRERYGFKGEVRATGNVLRDQYPLMRRCGFDAFEVKEGTDVAAWISSDRAITAPYQPAADGVQAVWAKRQALAKSA